MGVMSEKYFDVKKSSSYFQRVGNSGLDQSFSRLNVSHWGSCYQADSVWSLRFCISDELPGECQCCWREDHTLGGRTHRRTSMLEQSIPGLWLSGLCLPLQPEVSPLDPATPGHLGLSLAFAANSLPTGISPPYDPHPPLTPIHCPATWQTGLRVGPMVISSVSHLPPPTKIPFSPFQN